MLTHVWTTLKETKRKSAGRPSLKQPVKPVREGMMELMKQADFPNASGSFYGMRWGYNGEISTISELSPNDQTFQVGKYTDPE